MRIHLPGRKLLRLVKRLDDSTIRTNETIQRLVSRRSSLITSWKKFSADLGNACQTENNQDEIAVILAQTKTKWDKIKELTDKIDGEEGSEGYVQHELFDKYKDEMVANETIANRILQSTPSSQVRILPQPEPIHHSVRKLTTLELKTFRGDIQQWRPWWEAFRTTIDNNTQLENVEKFGYLDKYLEGPAAKVIQGMPLTGTMYAQAIERLRKRYGQDEQITRSHIKSLMTLPYVERIEHTRNLGNLVDTALVHIRALEDLKVPLNQYSIMAKTILLERIPSVLARLWYRQQNNESGGANELIEFIQNELFVQENIQQNIIRRQ